MQITKTLKWARARVLLLSTSNQAIRFFNWRHNSFCINAWNLFSIYRAGAPQPPHSYACCQCKLKSSQLATGPHMRESSWRWRFRSCTSVSNFETRPSLLLLLPTWLPNTNKLQTPSYMNLGCPKRQEWIFLARATCSSFFCKIWKLDFKVSKKSDKYLDVDNDGIYQFVEFELKITILGCRKLTKSDRFWDVVWYSCTHRHKR
jgi:hypothetical protein